MMKLFHLYANLNIIFLKSQNINTCHIINEHLKCEKWSQTKFILCIIPFPQNIQNNFRDKNKIGGCQGLGEESEKINEHSHLLSVAVVKHWQKSSCVRKGFCRLIDFISSLREVRAETQAGKELEARALEDCCLLACLLLPAHSTFLINQAQHS